MKLILENWKKYLEEEETEEETPEVDENLLNVARKAVQFSVGAHAKATLENIKAEDEYQKTGKRYGAGLSIFDFDSFPGYFTDPRMHRRREFVDASTQPWADDIKHGIPHIEDPGLEAALEKWESLDGGGRGKVIDKVYRELHAFGRALEKIWADPDLKEEIGKKLVEVTGYSWVQAASLAESLV